MMWFSNLKTMTKLMLAFFAMVAVMVGIGYMGTTNMAQVNDMLTLLYERDMKGLSELKDADINLIYLGRSAREVMLAKDPADVRRLSQEVDKNLAGLNEHLAGAEKTLATAKGKAVVAEIRHDLPIYVSFVREMVAHAESGRREEAMAALARAKDVGTRVDDKLSAVAAMKEDLGEQAYESSNALYARARNLMIWVIVGAALASIIAGLLIARLISRPLLGAVEVLRAIGTGDYTRRLDVDTKDEVGMMAAALNDAVANVRGALEEVRAVADTVAVASRQLSSASQEIATGAQEQASSLEETAASLEEITSTVKQNADNAQQANQLANDSREVADKGGQVVGHAVEAMAEINQSSKRIAEIITAIDEIAFQTNLLALNAAVEAARAGEQGRGFAVVAAEVRNLAQRSATAAREIKGLIQDSVRKVEAGSELVNRSGETLQQILVSVKRVTDIVSEIAAASREQTSGIEQVNKAVTQMDQVTQGNASQTEELSSTAESLSGQAEQLQGLVARFRLSADEGRRGASAPHARPSTPPARSRATAAPHARAARPSPGPAAREGHGTADAARDDAFVEF